MQLQKQRLRYLLTEQSRTVNKVRLNNLQRMKHIQDDMWAVQDSISESLHGKNQELSQCQISMQTMLHDLQLEKTIMESKLKLECSEIIRRMESKFKRLLFEREKEELVDSRDQNLRASTQRSEEVRQLVDIHNDEIQRLKTFFNEVTINNHAVITTLQQELVKIKTSDENTKGELLRARQEVQKLQDRMTEAIGTKEKEQKEAKMSSHTMHKHWARMDRIVKENEEKRRRLEISNEALMQKLQLVQNERDMLKKVFSRAIVDMQQKSSMNKILLEVKLAALASENQKKSVLSSESSQDGEPSNNDKEELSYQPNQGVQEDFSSNDSKDDQRGYNLG